MLVKSLTFKLVEKAGLGLSLDDQKRLEQLVKAYKRNPNCFDDSTTPIKPGTRIVRVWKGQRHSVIVQEKGFGYKDQIYSSLSEIASLITGSRWNGWIFFGLKKKGKLSEKA
jgi:plastocyanin